MVMILIAVAIKSDTEAEGEKFNLVRGEISEGPEKPQVVD
jgi:hypothetical protein